MHAHASEPYPEARASARVRAGRLHSGYEDRVDSNADSCTSSEKFQVPRTADPRMCQRVAKGFIYIMHGTNKGIAKS